MIGKDVAGKKISVIGGARSGIAVAKLLASRGAHVFVSDNGPAEKVLPALKELETAGIPYETGTHSSRVIDADLIVLSPGVPSTVPVIREAAGRGIPVLSELEVCGTSRTRAVAWRTRGASRRPTCSCSPGTRPRRPRCR